MSVNMNDPLDPHFWDVLHADIPEKDRVFIEEAEKDFRLQELSARALASQNPAELTQQAINKTVTIIQPQTRKTKRKSEETDSDYVLSDSESTSDASSEVYRSAKKKKQLVGKCHQWTSEEDRLIVKGVEIFPTFAWTDICKRFLPHLTPKQVRQRYHCYLNPAIKRDPWTSEELNKLKEGIKIHGLQGIKKWQNISQKVFNGQRTGKDCQEKYVRVILKPE